MKMDYPLSPFVRHPLVESQIIKNNCPAKLEELLTWLCQTPRVTTYRVNLLRTTLPAFKGTLEKRLATMYKDPPEVYEIPDVPEVLCIESLCKTTPTCVPHMYANEVIVDRFCGASLLRGAHLYAPGVLSMISGTKLNERVNVYVDLLGRCKRGTSKVYNSTEKLFIGCGVVRMQRHQLYSGVNADTDMQPKGVAVEMTQNIAGVPTLGDLSGPEALLQNFPSIVCGRVLDARPDDIVLDMCASPGNKTSHIAEMMNDRGVIIALDKTPRKVRILEAKCAENQLKCVRPFTYDATKSYDPNGYSRYSDNMAPPFTSNTFDRILLDAPCSALGQRPLLASDMTLNMLQSFVYIQRKLFDNAVPMLREGGTLVYSTCTITDDENEKMVAWALQRYPELQLVAAEPLFGSEGLNDVGLDEEQRTFVQRFGPSQYNRNGTDTVGFFIAKFIKIKPRDDPPVLPWSPRSDSFK